MRPSSVFAIFCFATSIAPTFATPLVLFNRQDVNKNHHKRFVGMGAVVGYEHGNSQNISGVTHQPRSFDDGSRPGGGGGQGPDQMMRMGQW
ncbi:hypothetical protein F5148DRAFT_1235397 [Russula earlei]|uniref:Uncharacterized protein n=1 Tax=Russula earlei TaxID=71964 RepID=A0ACC0TYE8_9AGAM|nr:hypothetical protein F5148DRAFT_1235397 [Russula earlei]